MNQTGTLAPLMGGRGRYHEQLISEDSHRARVSYSKSINEANEMLKALIEVGRMKKMELMSINNRALFNKGKVQRCEWLNKRRYSIGNSGFLPDIKNICLDARTPKKHNERQHRKKGSVSKS